MEKRAAPIVRNGRFRGRDGVQHGFLRLPYSRDDSAWGAVMIPITVTSERQGPDRAPDRRQSRRGV